MIRQVLTMDDLRDRAGSIFAGSGAGYVSDKYRHIATAEVVHGLMKEGFLPTMASQQRTRTEDRIGFQKHLVRFTHQSYLEGQVGEYHPEIVLVNSHDRTSAYHLYFGIFRLVCSNGLVVCSSDFGGLTVRHQGSIVDNVIEASYKVIDNAVEVQTQIDSFRAIELTPEQKIRFAERAMIAKWGNEIAMEKATTIPEQLIMPRRVEDNRSDLWTTFNTVQENLFKGGVAYNRLDRQGRVRTRNTRAIKGINETVMLNQKLWTLAENFTEVA